jgi:hypothetical protein
MAGSLNPRPEINCGAGVSPARAAGTAAPQNHGVVLGGVLIIEAWQDALAACRLRPRLQVLRFALRLLSMAGMVLLSGLHGRVAWGQDDWDVPKKAVNQPNQQFVMALPDFDQWVLGGKTRDQIERLVKSQLALQVDSVALACELSDAQREKLRLAGEGDLIRLHRTIEQFREKFRDAGQDQQKINTVVSEASSLQIKMQTGLYDDSSLYQKVLRQTLNHEQAARYEQQERERRKFHYEAKIELAMSNLENSISLRAEQRQRLVKLVLDETEPPKKTGQYDYYVVLLQMSRLDDEKLKPILDDAQRQSLKKVFDRYRGVEPFLRKQGYLP